MKFRLRQKLKAHTCDVRGLVALKDSSVLSVSRDGTCGINKKGEDGMFENRAFAVSDCFVNSVLHISADKMKPESIFSGCKEGVIIVGLAKGMCCCYDLHGQLQHTFEGRSTSISCLAFNERTGLLYAGSWDSSIKSYSMTDGKMRDDLTRHTNSVWCLEPVAPYQLLLSGSADTTVILWKLDRPVRNFVGHTQAVRAIQVLNNRKHFVTSGNDCSIRKWSLDDGNCLEVLDQMQSFVYSISVRDKMFVTAGEEGIVSVWQDNKSVQVLVLPCPSVWSVAWVSDEEFATACNDGHIRFYSCREDFEVLDDFDCAKVEVDDTDNSKILADDPNIPDISIGLTKEGYQDGQVTLVKNCGKVEVYEWNMMEKAWKLCGDVISGNSGTTVDNKKNYFNGKEYDYLFDVDFEGLRNLKLPYNKNDDPWETARDFCEVNELPITYMEQIVSFINANVQREVVPGPIASESVYQPSSAYISFRSTNYAALLRRLREVETKGSILPDGISMAAFYNFLEALVSGKEAKGYAAECKLCHLLKLFELCTESDILPLSDLQRLLFSYSEFTYHYDEEEGLVELFGRLCFSEAHADQVCRMMLLRALCNMFHDSPKTSGLPVSLFPNLREALLSPHMWSDKRVQIAAAGAVFNFTLLLKKKRFDCGILYTDISELILWVFEIMDHNLCQEAQFFMLEAAVIIVQERKSEASKFMEKVCEIARRYSEQPSSQADLKKCCEYLATQKRSY